MCSEHTCAYPLFGGGSIRGRCGADALGALRDSRGVLGSDTNANTGRKGHLSMNSAASRVVRGGKLMRQRSRTQRPYCAASRRASAARSSSPR